jgi:hypothetical protein
LVSASVWVLSVAVIAGAVLALWHLRATDDGAARPPLAAGLAHGTAGALGLVLLLLALRGPARGVEAGAGAFGTTAAVLFGAAVVSGLVILAIRRKAVVMAIHAGIAITAYVLLLAWNVVG